MDNAEMPFVLAHEYGHFMMEDALADNKHRAEIFNQVLESVSTVEGNSLIVSIMKSYGLISEEQWKSVTTETQNEDGTVTEVLNVPFRELIKKGYLATDADTRAKFEREVITNYLDQVARR